MRIVRARGVGHRLRAIQTPATWTKLGLAKGRLPGDKEKANKLLAKHPVKWLNRFFFHVGTLERGVSKTVTLTLNVDPNRLRGLAWKAGPSFVGDMPSACSKLLI